MNKEQFLSKWCPTGKRDEMEIDLEMHVKDAIEDKETWRFRDVPDDSSDFDSY